MPITCYSKVLEDFNSGYIEAFTKPTSLFFDIIIGPTHPHIDHECLESIWCKEILLVQIVRFYYDML